MKQESASGSLHGREFVPGHDLVDVLRLFGRGLGGRLGFGFVFKEDLIDIGERFLVYLIEQLAAGGLFLKILEFPAEVLLLFQPSFSSPDLFLLALVEYRGRV